MPVYVKLHTPCLRLTAKRDALRSARPADVRDQSRVHQSSQEGVQITATDGS